MVHSPSPAYRAPRRPRRRAVVLCVLLGVALAGSAAAQAESHVFTATAAGGIGGPINVDEPDPGLDNTGFQLGFSWLTAPKSRVSARLGQLDMSGEQLEGLLDPELTYVNIGGEYRYTETYYESGLYLGLGLYQLDGDRFVEGVPQSDDETALGLVLGATGDFPINDRFSVIVELSAHYADFDRGNVVFGLLHAGVAYRF